MIHMEVENHDDYYTFETDGRINVSDSTGTNIIYDAALVDLRLVQYVNATNNNTFAWKILVLLTHKSTNCRCSVWSRSYTVQHVKSTRSLQMY